MKVFVNAVNLSSAGGLNVALNFLSVMQDYCNVNFQIQAVVPPNCDYEKLSSPFLEILVIPNYLDYTIARAYVDYVYIPAKVNHWNPDVIFTMGNFPTPVKVKQAVLLHYPHIAYPDGKEIWSRLDYPTKLSVIIRNKLFESRIKYINILFVQTSTIKQRMQMRYPDINNIELMPNAYSGVNVFQKIDFDFARHKGVRYLLVLTRYYQHKNLEILIELAILIRDKSLPFRILLTIESEQHPGAKRLLRSIYDKNLGDYLINLGNIKHSHIGALYHSIDGLLLPTLLESFTATYVDAMHFGIPIFTSRRDFATEICEDVANYFDPLDANDIMNVILTAFNNLELIDKKLVRGKEKSQKFLDWHQISLDCMEHLKKLANSDLDS